MAEDTQRFHIEGSWTGDSENGTGVLRGSGDELRLDYPVHLGGREGRSNPEELLMQAVAGCYGLTLVSVAERRRGPVSSVEILVGGEGVRQPGGTPQVCSMGLR